MIFVSVGSSRIPFDRLLRAIDAPAGGEEVVVQHGVSRIRPLGAKCVGYVGYEEFVRLVRAARVVVTHAGVGSVMTAVEHSKRPLVVPRRVSHGEAVDDHQVTFARRADDLGLVMLVENVDELTHAIAAHEEAAVATPAGRSPIEVELRSYIEECVGSLKPTMSIEGKLG